VLYGSWVYFNENKVEVFGLVDVSVERLYDVTTWDSTTFIADGGRDVDVVGEFLHAG